MSAPAAMAALHVPCVRCVAVAAARAWQSLSCATLALLPSSSAPQVAVEIFLLCSACAPRVGRADQLSVAQLAQLRSKRPRHRRTSQVALSRACQARLRTITCVTVTVTRLTAHGHCHCQGHCHGHCHGHVRCAAVGASDCLRCRLRCRCRHLRGSVFRLRAATPSAV